MSRKWFLWRALGALVVVGVLAGLLIVGGLTAHRIGWSQGYTAGQLAVEGEEGDTMPAVPPYTPRGFGYPVRHFFSPFLCGLGLIFKIGLLFLLFVVIGNVFRWLVWRKVMIGGPWPMGAHSHHWGKSSRHWRHASPPHRGPAPPWCWGWEEPSKEKTEETQAEPDAEPDTAEV